MSVDVQTAAGLITLLDEPEQELHHYALQKMNILVESLWPQIAEAINKIEILHEEKNFEGRELAALVASKVYYYLGEYDEALNFALQAGDNLDLTTHTEYTELILEKLIDKYISTHDPSLEPFIGKIFTRYLQTDTKLALGLAIETQKLDIIENIIKTADDEQLAYAFELVISIADREFRQKILIQIMATAWGSRNVSLLAHLSSGETYAGELLYKLTQDKLFAQAYQIAFDVWEAEVSPEWLMKVKTTLTSLGDSDEITKICSILSGELPTLLRLEFLYQNNNTDVAILNQLKESLEARNSIFHSALTFANAFMNAGTTSDTFVRQNLDWLAKANNWAKFTATAGLGVIHTGHIKEGLVLLGPYLPQQNSAPGANYSEGGSLFAMGLIFANQGQTEQAKPIFELFLQSISETQDEVILHGACLGLAVLGMGINNSFGPQYYDKLKDVLFTDNAVSGEGAAYAMGMLHMGDADMSVVEEMITYAHETQHEKIIRALAVAIAMVMVGVEQVADSTIDALLADSDPILRYGGVQAIGLAYVGTGSNVAIKKLLHSAISDVNDDVRRAAVYSLGFILCNNPSALPKLVELLSESYNPHVRYGAAMALGIACAGTAMNEAIDILTPMSKDPVDFVRQAALIATAMILVQQNDQSNPSVVEFKKRCTTTVSGKHEEAISKFGASIAQGIINAGGRNETITLLAPTGNPRRTAVIGMVLFMQYWYWFPLTHFLAFAFKPTGLIALNTDLKVPEFTLTSNARPSLFNYPPVTEEKKDVAPETVKTAVLSTTRRAEVRAKKSEKEKADKEGDVAMEVDEKDETKSQKTDVDTHEEKKKRTAKEPNFKEIGNFTRVTPQQWKYITFKDDSRYKPIRSKIDGFALVEDQSPNEPEQLIQLVTAGDKSNDGEEETQETAEPAADEVPIAPMPSDFEYDFDNESDDE